MSHEDRFWKKYWDEGLEDLDPDRWESLGSIANAIQKSIDDFPDKIALEFLGVELTFNQLNAYSNQFAHALLENGLEEGDVVAIHLPNNIEYVIALIGTLKAGCIVSGVSILSRDVQIQYQLSDILEAGKKVALVTLDTYFVNRVEKIISTLPQLKLVVISDFNAFISKFRSDSDTLKSRYTKNRIKPLFRKGLLDFHEDILEKYPSTPLDVDHDASAIACIQYTGGTTGPPKGAMLTHSNILSNLVILNEWFGLKRGEDVACTGFPFFHIAGLSFCLNCLFNAQKQVLVPDPRDINYIIDALKNNRPSIITNVPVLYQLLLNNENFKKLDFSNLKYCFTSAAPFPLEIYEDLESVIGEGKLLELYGMTETSPVITINPFKGKKKPGSIGLPIMNTEIKIVDVISNKEVPLGAPGEIFVRGPQVMQGYYNKPEETKNAIDEEGFFHTGDIAVMDEEGYLKIVDRSKDMIIVSGYKVFSKKVEETIYRHPAIDNLAIIGVPNPKRPGSEIVKAFIKIDEDYQTDKDEKSLKEEIEDFARKRCSPYEVPKIIQFVDDLPLTAEGNIDKKQLRNRTN
ncbi:MAG: AMP-binding protein [Candidatus Lokiarchaeota archaeon]|nr:AMP-binding protein [Candidatus Lokiarchaeota archaeon]